MDENDKAKNEFMTAILKEISENANAQEDAVTKTANMLWLQYCAFIRSGFSEEQSFTLVGVMLTTLLGGKK